MKKLLSGNEAIALGIYEANVKLCAAYPGTPSTEILEEAAKLGGTYCEWAPNEKVAAEVAFGASIAGSRSLCAMKHVGMNVAADPMFTASYLGCEGGFVMITADDPSMHSSQNEQDNRHYARAAKLPMVEPSDSQECKDFLKAAFELSERFKTPVIFRTTTRVSHAKSLVEPGQREADARPYEYRRDPGRFVCTPAVAYRRHPEVEQRTLDLAEFGGTSPLNRLEMNGSKLGVVTSGVSYLYAKEVFPEDASFLKLGLTHPLPMELIRDFASRVEKLYVVEELDPFIENELKAAGINCVGKALTGLCYEFNTAVLAERLLGERIPTTDVDCKAVARPPALCPGCPHRGFFYAIGKNKNYVVTGDIGCYALGAGAPLNAVDASICMGGGFTLGAGMAKAFRLQGKTEKRVFGVLGDSTFFHNGIPGAVEIMYNNAEVIPVVLDNHITGMTGHQDNPGTGYDLMGEPAAAIKIEDVLSAVGFENVIIADPLDLPAMERAIAEAVSSEKRAAIITRRPCLLAKRDAKKGPSPLCAVDADKCRGCKKCAGVGCAAISVAGGKAGIDATQCVGCGLCMQVCPFGAITKEDR